MQSSSSCTSRVFSSIICSSARSVASVDSGSSPALTSSSSSDVPWTKIVGSRSTSSNVAARQAQRPRHQHVVERPLLAQPLEHRLADLEQRLPLELGVQVVRRLLELRRGCSPPTARSPCARCGRRSRPRRRASCRRRAARSRDARASLRRPARSRTPTWCDARETSCETCDSSRRPCRRGAAGLRLGRVARGAPLGQQLVDVVPIPWSVGTRPAEVCGCRT